MSANLSGLAEFEMEKHLKITETTNMNNTTKQNSNIEHPATTTSRYICVNDPSFDYDIHSLIKAFFPEEEVKVIHPEEEHQSEEIDFSIEFQDQKILFHRKGQALCEPEVLVSSERAEIKNQLKRALYLLLSKETGHDLPWGNLTGIRPTKIPMSYLEQNVTHEEIISRMKQQYFVSDEKARLSLEIAKHEQKLLQTIHMEQGYSLYIGIPFCPTTCLYCSFTSYPIRAYRAKVPSYLHALEQEMVVVSELMKGKILDTVYIGGGTPTTLEAEEFEQLFSALNRHFDLKNILEFTVEAGRADSITIDKLKVLKKWGVDRISINPQTMKEQTLKIIGRQHTVEQVRQAFYMAREVGFTNINMDIILGLPDESPEDVKDTMEEIKKLHPDSLTIHTLAIKRASKMNQWMEEHGRVDTKATDMAMEYATKAAREMDMEAYYLYRQKNMSGNLENTGYATKGNSGIYNILIMEEKQTIVALGAGSISKVLYQDGRIERKDNVKDVDQYLSRIDEMLDRKRELLK